MSTNIAVDAPIVEVVASYSHDEKGRRLDTRGRPNVGEMTDIEMLDEITHTIRAIGDAVAEFQGMNPTQIMSMLMRGGK